MDISIIKAVVSEISGALTGARLAIVDEGEGGELYITFKGKGEKRVLLIAPRPPEPRLYLISEKPPRSKAMTPFAQSLENHIAGATLDHISQEGLERVVVFHLTKKSRQGAQAIDLVFELTGKKPNLILVEGGAVVLAQSYVSPSEDTQRPILPGMRYDPPPTPERVDPHRLTLADIKEVFRDDAPPDKALAAKVGGISPLMAREAASGAGRPPDAATVLASLNALIEKVENGPYGPCVYDTPKGPVLAAFPLKSLDGLPVEAFGSMSGAAEVHYRSLADKKLAEARRNAAAGGLRTRLNTATKKLAAIESDLKAADKADLYQRYGNLLMASLNSLAKDAESVTLPDLFSEDGGDIIVPLDPKLSPVRNAEAYFKKAKKARAGAVILGKRRDDTLKEVERLKAQLDDVLSERPAGSTTALEKPPHPISPPLKKKLNEKQPEFPSFVSSDGYEVFYGKNARQNDLLTFKFAGPMDMWFHAQGFRGSHVIVRNPERRPDIPLQTILEAAEVAAYVSEATRDGQVAVDYTFRKYVRKPKDPTPGQAIFTNNKTVFVAPKKPRQP